MGALERFTKRLTRIGPRAILLAGMAAAALGCAAGALTTTAARAPTHVAHQADAQAFWNSFRAAIGKQDWDALACMSAKPLVLRGEVDGVPAKRISGGKVLATLREQLGKSVFAGKGKVERSVADWVRETPSLAAEHWVAQDQFRVQNLAFRKGRDGWKLATIYDEDL